MKNIFIIGPVASGKNTLMDKILKDCDAIALDTGQIYRYVSFKIYEKIKDEIDIDKIIKNDSFEIEKTIQLIYHLTKYYTQQLLLLSFNGKKLYNNVEEVQLEKLYTKETNSLLPIISKISTVRNKINQFINNCLSSSQKPIIMTGHNIREINTTKFTIVYLDVSAKRSAYRLFNRNIQSYEDIIDAYDEVNRRNNVDQIELTKKIIPYLYSCIYINTDNKSSEEIYLEFLKKRIFNGTM